MVLVMILQGACSLVVFVFWDALVYATPARAADLSHFRLLLDRVAKPRVPAGIPHILHSRP